jgi:hypothetical protein
VDKYSATLGLAGHREEVIGIEADHRTICKFDDPKNSNYQQVKDNIVKLAKKAVQKAQYVPVSTFRRDSTMLDFGAVPKFRRSSTIPKDYKPPGPICK